MGEDRFRRRVHGCPVRRDGSKRSASRQALDLAAVEEARIDRSAKSSSDLNGPFARRSSTKCSIAFSPTPFSAPSA
jgi:hypothetical protein